MVDQEVMVTLVDTKELTNLIKLLKRHGVVSYATPTLTLVLDGKMQPRGGRALKEALDRQADDQKPLTDEDLLFWSSAGLPDEDKSE